MPLKTLIVIALRLCAIYWLVEGLSSIVTVFPMMWAFQKQIEEAVSQGGNRGITSFLYLALPLSQLVLAIVLWVFASILSSQVTKGHDTQLAFTALTKEDFYSFAFVFLGLYFVLSSISSAVRDGYTFFAYEYPQSDNNPEKGRFLWPFLSHIATLAAGFICIFGAKVWTRKLIRLENKSETPTDSNP